MHASLINPNIEKGLSVELTAPYTFCDFQLRRGSASSDVITSSPRHRVTPRPRCINANCVEPETRAPGVPLLPGSSRNALEALRLGFPRHDSPVH